VQLTGDFNCALIFILPGGVFVERMWSDYPNQETLEAIAEVQEMKRNPSLGKPYTDIDEMMRELLA
jgi:hypothetical protein